MDGSMGGDYRFVTVGVSGQGGVSIVLHKPMGSYPEARSNVHGLLFHCDDCRQQVEDLKNKRVKFTLEPEEQPWGVQAVFEDLYADIPQIEPPFLDIAPAGMLPTIISHSKGVKCVLIRSNSSFHGPTTVLPSVKSPNRLSTTKSLPWEALLPCTTR